MRMSHSPEVKSSLKQSRAITSKWFIHIFTLVVHNSNPAASTAPLVKFQVLQIWGQKSCQSQKQPLLTWIILKTYVVFFMAFTKGTIASQVLFFMFLFKSSLLFFLQYFLCCTWLQLEKLYIMDAFLKAFFIYFNFLAFLYLLEYLFVKLHPLLRFPFCAMSLFAQPSSKTQDKNICCFLHVVKIIVSLFLICLISQSRSGLRQLVWPHYWSTKLLSYCQGTFLESYSLPDNSSPPS